MVSTLYLIPSILGRHIDKYDMWHASNDQDIEYVQYLPLQVRDEIRLSEIEWLTELYDSFEFKRLRQRYVSIYRELLHQRNIEKREKLIDEADRLLDTFH